MKKIIFTLSFIFISLTAVALEPTEIKFIGYSKATIRTVCVSGYTFVIVKAAGNGISITQVFEKGNNSGNNPAQPKKCR